MKNINFNFHSSFLKLVLVFSIFSNLNSSFAKTKLERAEDDYEDARDRLSRAEKKLKRAKKDIAEAKEQIITDINTVKAKVAAKSGSFSSAFTTLLEDSYTQDGGPVCTTVSTINTLFTNVVSALASKLLTKIESEICVKVVPCSAIKATMKEEERKAGIDPDSWSAPPLQAKFTTFVSNYNLVTGNSISLPDFSSYPPTATQVVDYLNSLLVSIIVSSIGGVISDATPIWSTLTTNCGNMSQDISEIDDLEDKVESAQRKRDHACRSWHAVAGRFARCKK